MPRARRRTLDAITFNVTLTGGDLTRWASGADRSGLTLEQFVHRAVERELEAILGNGLADADTHRS